MQVVVMLFASQKSSPTECGENRASKFPRSRLVDGMAKQPAHDGISKIAQCDVGPQAEQSLCTISARQRRKTLDHYIHVIDIMSRKGDDLLQYKV